MPVNPKVEIPLQQLTDPNIIECFDQLRRWFLNYEQNNAPTFQTFEGITNPSQRIFLNVPGKLYGVTGFTTSGGPAGSETSVKSEGVDVWFPMVFQGTVGNKFLGGAESWFTIENTSATAPVSYRVTAFYRK